MKPDLVSYSQMAPVYLEMNNWSSTKYCNLHTMLKAACLNRTSNKRTIYHVQMLINLAVQDFNTVIKKTEATYTNHTA